MSAKIDKLLKKREQLEREILEAQAIEKRMARVQQLVAVELEKHSQLMLADDQILRDQLEHAFNLAAQNLAVDVAKSAEFPAVQN